MIGMIKSITIKNKRYLSYVNRLNKIIMIMNSCKNIKYNNLYLYKYEGINNITI